MSAFFLCQEEQDGVLWIIVFNVQIYILISEEVICFMGWFILGLVIIILLGVCYRRNVNHNYRMGSGLFKSSDSNLDEKEDFCDKDYYDKDGSMK